MSIYDRDYIRSGWDARRSGGFGGGGWTATQALIALNLLVFIAQALRPGLAYLLAVSTETWGAGRHWQWITAALLHLDLLHIAFNMYALWWSASELESIYGKSWTFLFYGATGLFSNIAFVLWAWQRGEPSMALSASGAVMAFMTLYTFHYPTRELLIFGILPLQMRWALLLYVLLDISGAVGGGSVVGNAAHLGGAACGAGYALWKRGR